MNEHEIAFGDEHGLHFNIEVTRKLFWWEAREVRVIRLEEAPCGHEECREQLAYGPILARSLSKEGVHRAAARAILERVLESRHLSWDEQSRQANEFLGG